MKDVVFLGDSLDVLRSFPERARRMAGFQLDRVQRGLEPFDWKPMTSIGAGVQEIRIRDEHGAFRIIYLARLSDAIHVLHCFQKKTQRTSPRDLDVARRRFHDLTRTRQ